jgi:hypothetical protein
LILTAMSLAGCGMSMSEMTLFPDKGNLFKSQDWATTGAPKNAPAFTSSLPASAEELVDGSGRCASQAVAASSDPAVGSLAGDLAGAAAPAPVEQALAPGGVALGMTECQVVSRAGQAGQVDIGANERGDRKVVLTYLSGPWPGIYTFTAGRLTVVDRVAQPEPPKPARKKPRSPKTASSNR